MVETIVDARNVRRLVPLDRLDVVFMACLGSDRVPEVAGRPCSEAAFVLGEVASQTAVPGAPMKIRTALQCAWNLPQNAAQERVKREQNEKRCAFGPRAHRNIL